MPQEVLEFLRPAKGSKFVDATLGYGGHSELILKNAAPDSWLIGIDQDAEALAFSRERLKGFAARIDLVKSNFRYLGEIVRKFGMEESDGVLFDLGVSSNQLSKESRGFSFKQSGPLDMRMDQEQELTAAAIVNQYDEAELTRIIEDYGEERWAARIARFIVEERDHKPILTTAELVDTMRRAIPSKLRHGRKTHFATRTFQALRMAVNDELAAFEAGLAAAFNHLRQGGRMVIITFHSLEDRMVKRSFKRWAQEGLGEQKLRIITRKPILPTAQEIEFNPRSRSAKLRVAEKL